MNLIFEHGNRDAPVGHALIYFRGSNGAILATYVSVPPIQFDLSSYIPGFLAGAMQGMDLSNAMVATPMPPIPEEVPSAEYLQSLAQRRQDDLVFAGGTMQGDPMRLAAEAAEAARQYGELYQASPVPTEAEPEPVVEDAELARLSAMTEQELINELTILTGRLRDSLRYGEADAEIERQMQRVASLLPAKYRAQALVAAARVPGERGQKLAELHLERCYKLYHEEYLDLDRIDREIAAIQG